MSTQLHRLRLLVTGLALSVTACAAPAITAPDPVPAATATELAPPPDSPATGTVTPTAPLPPTGAPTAPVPTPTIRDLPGDRPNIVLFLVDDMRTDDLKYMPHTRRLLGRDGATLTDVISAHPICCPARAEILTGQYAQNNGVRHNTGPHGGYAAFDPTATIATALDDAGYHTALHGKYLNQYKVADKSTEIGWDTWDALAKNVFDYRTFTFANGDEYTGDYVTTRLTERSIATMTAAAEAGTPFFSFVNHVAPHYAFGPSWDRHINPPPAHPRRAAAARTGDTAPTVTDPAFNEADVTDLPADYQAARRTPKRWAQRWFDARIASLAEVDAGVAATVAALGDAGVLDDTYLIFTSDNGYLLGEHRLHRKNRFYDQVLSIPFLIRGPGVTAGTRVPVPANLADLGVTILDAAAAEHPVRVDGVSLLPHLSGADAHTPARWRDTGLLLSGRETGDGWGYRGVRTDRYTYAEAWHDPQVRMLFDRARDPHELTSVAADPRYRSVARELHRRTRILSRCAGPETCHQRFGPVPGPVRR